MSNARLDRAFLVAACLAAGCGTPAGSTPDSGADGAALADAGGDSIVVRVYDEHRALLAGATVALDTATGSRLARHPPASRPSRFSRRPP